MVIVQTGSAADTNHCTLACVPQETVLFLPFCEMSWTYKECHDNGEEFYSALILEFDCSYEPGKVKQLKIFSRQVCSYAHTCKKKVIMQCIVMYSYYQVIMQKTSFVCFNELATFQYKMRFMASLPIAAAQNMNKHLATVNTE